MTDAGKSETKMVAVDADRDALARGLAAAFALPDPGRALEIIKIASGLNAQVSETLRKSGEGLAAGSDGLRDATMAQFIVLASWMRAVACAGHAQAMNAVVQIFEAACEVTSSKKAGAVVVKIGPAK